MTIRRLDVTDFDSRQGMTTVSSRVSRAQLRSVQARAERCGYEGDELREIMAMLCQPPRVTVFSSGRAK